MRIIQLKCPSCGSSLQVEDGLETFFCQYCGQRIILADQDEYIVKAKVDLEAMKHEERMYQMEIEETKRKDKDLKKIGIILISFIAICFIVLFLLEYVIK